MCILNTYEHRDVFGSPQPISKNEASKTRQEHTGRSRAFLAAEAISAYLDTNEWQVAGITKALASLDEAKASLTRVSANGLLPGRRAKSVDLLGVYDAPLVP